MQTMTIQEVASLLEVNEPYQAYVDEGYFNVVLKQVNNGDAVKVTLVTGKGLAWIQKRYDHVRLKVAK